MWVLLSHWLEKDFHRKVQSTSRNHNLPCDRDLETNCKGHKDHRRRVCSIDCVPHRLDPCLRWLCSSSWNKLVPVNRAR